MLSLKQALTSHFLRYSLIPILVIEISLLLLYFGINDYISEKNTDLIKKDTLYHTQKILENETLNINSILKEIRDLTVLIQNNHQNIFSNPDLYPVTNAPTLKKATNGVLFKENKNGSSLYYSSKTKITSKETHKAILTEAMDPLLMDIVNLKSNISAAYFNSYDDMNRLYPYIDKVYEQYGEHIHMEDYNFYYLADKKHNPEGKTVWTDAYLDPAGNGWMISSIAPIYNNDFLEGVSGIDFTIDKLVSNLLDKTLPYESKMFLVDSKGMILAMPVYIEKLLGLQELKAHIYDEVIKETVAKPEDFNLYENQTPYGSNFKKILESNNSVSELSLHDKKHIVLVDTVEETNWKLFILLDEEKIFSSAMELKELSTFIGYLAIIFMAIFYLLFFYFLLKKSLSITNNIAVPINKLTSLTTSILVNKSKIETIDTNIKEIDFLNSNFIKMSEELEDRTNTIVEIEIQKQKTEEEAKEYFERSIKDPLTGAYNRRFFLETGESIFNKSKRANKKLALAMLDIDKFKNINDTYGHDVGDVAIKEVVKILDDNLRSSDLIARFGGEEFCMLVEDLPLENISKLFEKIRTKFETNILIVNDIEIKFTVSIGICYGIENTLASMIKISDQSLYYCKNNGRNQVHITQSIGT